MVEPLKPNAPPPPALLVAAGQDRTHEKHGLGITSMDFKIISADNTGVFIYENTFHARGGPARHLHYNEDEWFYVLEGDFLFEVSGQALQAAPGDALLVPRTAPHALAFVGAGRGKLLAAFFPAGKMEAFFREVTRANAMPPQDPALWRAYGMELLGPPLALP